jgi:hypothetical protein
MTNVNVGCEYVVKKNFTINGSEIKEGKVLYAWFCGQLVMVETVNGRLTFNEYPTSPNWIIRNIENGKLELKGGE